MQSTDITSWLYATNMLTKDTIVSVTCQFVKLKPGCSFLNRAITVKFVAKQLGNTTHF